MALSQHEKLRKAQVLAVGIRMLRERMRWSQEGLAEEINADSGSISRWERADFSPNPSKRKRLAAIARKHGWGDLVMAFEEPLYEWQAALLSEQAQHLCALFEIAMLNLPLPGQRFETKAPRPQYASLIKSLRTLVRSFKSSRKSERTIWTVTDRQVAAWQRETQPRKVQALKRDSTAAGDRPGLILYYNDGRVEMYRDENEYKKTMRQRAREEK
jgi:transcriptional regulator with XRE-family HTH domain